MTQEKLDQAARLALKLEYPTIGIPAAAINPPRLPQPKKPAIEAALAKLNSKK